jgi:hypothetical protein
LLGVSSAVITVQILATNLTSLAEEYTFVMTSVDPPGTSTLNINASQFNFILPDVGNPGGVFSFGPDMNSSYVIRVSALHQHLIRVDTACKICRDIVNARTKIVVTCF